VGGLSLFIESNAHMFVNHDKFCVFLSHPSPIPPMSPRVFFIGLNMTFVPVIWVSFDFRPYKKN